jgi:hypothetical protein
MLDNKDMKIFSAIIVTVIICVSTVLIVGHLSSQEYGNELSALYDYKINRVWEVLTTIEKYPENKKDLLHLEILDGSYGKIFEWREIYSDKVMEYKIIEDSPYYYVLEVSENDFYKGTFEYYLEFDSKTKLTIKETSFNENIWERGLDVIFRREQRINREFKWIRVSLLSNLIYEI